MSPATGTFNRELHSSEAAVYRWFTYGHLPERLQAVSQPFEELACHIVNSAPSSPETTVALRKLLEAKDCAVRAALS
jgi:hypothetical protein